MKRKNLINALFCCALCLSGTVFALNNQTSQKDIRQQQSVEDQKIEDLLAQAKGVRQARERYEEEAERVEKTKPEEAERLRKLADEKHDELNDLLKKLEELIKQRNFTLEQEGDPDDEQYSPYQP